MTTFISVLPRDTAIFFDNNRVQSKVISELSVILPGRNYVPSYQNYKSKNPNLNKRCWDGIIRHYRIKKSDGSIHIATGHLPIIIAALKQMNEVIEMNNPYLWNSGDVNTLPTLEQLKLKGITLRGDQIEAIQKCIQIGRGIIQAEMGSGKTEIMLALIKWFCFHNKEDVLILTNRKAIKEGSTGLEGRFEERLTLGKQKKITDGIYLMEYQGCTLVIAMVQSLANLLTSDDAYKYAFTDWMRKDVGLVFCDEIHQRELAGRRGSHKLIDDKKNKKVDFFKYLDTYHCFGMSATPFDFDGYSEDKLHRLDVMKNFGEVIEVDYKLPVTVKVYIDTIKYQKKTTNYHKAAEQTDNNADRIRCLENTIRYCKEQGRFSLLFVKYLKQGNILSYNLERRGVRNIFLQGKSSQKKREEGIKKLLNGEIDVLIVDEIFYYGINIPEIDCIIFWFIGKSYLNVIQTIGRGTRKHEGKTDLWVFDYDDQDRSYLQNHSKIRLSYYKKKGYEVNL